MIKNLIIMMLFLALGLLLIQNPKNINVLVKDAAVGKEMIIDGADYLHETIDRQFEVHSEEEFKKEHGVDRNIEERLETLKKKIKKFEEPVA